MSQYHKKHPSKPKTVIQFGNDHVLGRFYTIYEESAITDDNDEGVTEDKSEAFDALTAEDFAKKLEEFEVDPSIVLLAKKGRDF